MRALKSEPLNPAKRAAFSVLNTLVPGLGFLLKHDFKAATLNFLGFLVFVAVFPFIVGHENQSAIPFGYGFAMLGSGLACWGEPA